jgi:hypothetical protein
MWSIIKNIVISVLLIYIAHTSWNYILQACTTKKKKNLVKFQNDKYASIINSFAKHNENTSELSDFSSLGMTSEEIDEMKADLLTEAAGII